MGVVRVENGVVVQRWNDVTTVDEHTNKYGAMTEVYVSAEARPDWTYDNGSFSAPAPDTTITKRMIIDEVSRRIQVYADNEAWVHMAAKRAAGQFSTADAAAFDAGVMWVDAMRAKGAELLAAQNPNYAIDDALWPAAPQAAVDLAANY